MAIKFADNLAYSGKKPDFERQQYETFEAMKAVGKNSMPELYLAYCLEDRKVYLYDKNNEDDPVTGKFCEFNGSGGGSDIQKAALPEAGESELGNIYQYVGLTGLYTRGFFYECIYEDRTETVSVTTVDGLKEAVNRSDETIQLQIDTETVVTDVKAFINNLDAYYVYDENAYGGVLTDVVIQTMVDLKDFIGASDQVVVVKLADDSTVTAQCIDYSGSKIFVYEDVIYSGVPNVDEMIVLADATVYDTDEAVAALGIVSGQKVILADSTLYDTDEAVAALGLSYDVIIREYSWSNIDVSSGGGTIQTISIEEIDELFD